jgi:hypothetical protein
MDYPIPSGADAFSLSEDENYVTITMYRVADRTRITRAITAVKDFRELGTRCILLDMRQSSIEDSFVNQYELVSCYILYFHRIHSFRIAFLVPEDDRSFDYMESLLKKLDFAAIFRDPAAAQAWMAGAEKPAATEEAKTHSTY